MDKTPLQHSTFSYAFQEIPDKGITDIIEEIPSRWGRMPPLSRLLVVETGRVLKQHGLLQHGRNIGRTGKTVGLIGGTSSGSFTTDKEFALTLTQGPELASPSLFGYTLANIPLAEAANHYGLFGPVYAIVDDIDPLQNAFAECKRFLHHSKRIDYMLACCFDDFGSMAGQQQLNITFLIAE